MRIINDELFNQDAFKNIDAQKMEVIKRLVKKCEGKRAMEIIDIFCEESDALNGGKPLSEAEQRAVIAAMTAKMTQSDRRRFEQALAILQNHI